MLVKQNVLCSFSIEQALGGVTQMYSFLFIIAERSLMQFATTDVSGAMW